MFLRQNRAAYGRPSFFRFIKTSPSPYAIRMFLDGCQGMYKIAFMKSEDTFANKKKYICTYSRQMLIEHITEWIMIRHTNERIYIHFQNRRTQNLVYEWHRAASN